MEKKKRRTSNIFHNSFCWHNKHLHDRQRKGIDLLFDPYIFTSLDSGAEVVVSDASVSWRGGMQSSSWPEGLELRHREQDQNY